MTETYDQLGGQIPDVDDQAIINDFITCLDMRVRRRFDRNPRTFALILAAVKGGWKAKPLAEMCSNGIPTTAAAGATITRRLEWANSHAPTPARAVQPIGRKAPRQRHSGDCNHPDGHICPWIEVGRDKVVRCDCHTRPGGAA